MALLWFSVLLFFALDQGSKLWASKALAESSIKLRLFDFNLVFNRGIAFGLGQNLGIWILLTTGVFLLLGFGILALRPPRGIWGRWGLVLLLSGAVGNFFDRLRIGAVIDFIDFRFFPVFNLADTFITFGTIFLAIALWKLEMQGGK